MSFRKTVLTSMLTVALTVGSLSAGEVIEPAPTSNSNGEKVLIAAVIIGLVAWIAGSNRGGASGVSRQAPAEDDAKGEILMEF